MSQELGVSRQSIREAMSTAKAAGLIEVRQGEGAFVISSFKDNIGAPLSILLAEQAEKIFEFLEIRKLIEVWCAEKAAQNANAADLRHLRRILQRMQTAVPTEALWEKADYEFHSSIAGASHNVIAMHIMDGLKETFDSYFRVKKFTTRPERKDILLRQHRSIYEAIRSKDAKEARKRILEHLDYVEEMISEDLLKNRAVKKG
jgi:GntR family transcriptional repressor for pyruvate dehydrogenase complex